MHSKGMTNPPEHPLPQVIELGSFFVPQSIGSPTNDVGQHEVALQTTEADVSSMFDSISTRAATIVFSSFATLSRMLLSEENMSS